MRSPPAANAAGGQWRGCVIIDFGPNLLSRWSGMLSRTHVMPSASGEGAYLPAVTAADGRVAKSGEAFLSQHIVVFVKSPALLRDELSGPFAT
jgi:hypothetical protein